MENFDADMQLKLKYFKRNFHIFRYLSNLMQKNLEKFRKKLQTYFLCLLLIYSLVNYHKKRTHHQSFRFSENRVMINVIDC